MMEVSFGNPAFLLLFFLLSIEHLVLSSVLLKRDVHNDLQGLPHIKHKQYQILNGKAGSNFTMPGLEQDQYGGVIEWEVSQSMEEPLLYSSVLTHYFEAPSSPDVFSAYNKRISFFKSNGSFTLHQLQKSDERIYRMKINLTESRFIVLRVYEPISNVSIYCVPVENNSFLLCCNFSGDAGSVLWSMDGKSVPAAYKLMNRNRTLQIPWTAACSVFQCKVFSDFGKEFSDSKYDRDDELCKSSTIPVIILVVSSVAIVALAILAICCCCKRNKIQNTVSYWKCCNYEVRTPQELEREARSLTFQDGVCLKSAVRTV